MTYFENIALANDERPLPVLNDSYCFCCSQKLSNSVVSYDAFPTGKLLTSVFMHRDCAFAMAQRIICDAWPNHNKDTPIQVDGHLVKEVGMVNLQIEFDGKRSGYFVSGYGFDFFAYFTGDNKIEYLECSDVRREGCDSVQHLKFRLTKQMSNDIKILEKAIQSELENYWCIHM